MTLAAATNIVEERVRFAAGEGVELAGTLTYSEQGATWARILLCCPHPFLGGTPDNPVVLALAAGFARAGAAVLAWEYRTLAQDASLEEREALREAFWRDHRVDVERSDDLADARRSLDWLARLDLGDASAEAPLMVAGYSYGAALALLIAGEDKPAFVVSPPVRALPAAWTLKNPRVACVVAEDDLAVSPQEIDALLRRSSADFAERQTLPGDHFFRETTGEIERLAEAWLASHCCFVPREVPKS
jgi:alpha/beta superfamily hydrolase